MKILNNCEKSLLITALLFFRDELHESTGIPSEWANLSDFRRLKQGLARLVLEWKMDCMGGKSIDS